MEQHLSFTNVSRAFPVRMVSAIILSVARLLVCVYYVLFHYRFVGTPRIYNVLFGFRVEEVGADLLCYEFPVSVT